MAPIPGTSVLTSLRRRWRAFVVLHRVPLIAVAVGLAVLAGLRAVSPPPPASTAVVVAAHDLPGGRLLTESDLAVREVPTAVVPAGVAPDRSTITGRTLAAPVRAGEAITDRRVLAPGLLAAHPASVAVPVHVADPRIGRLLRVGDRVDLVAATANGTGATVVTDAAPVLALPNAQNGPGPDAGVGSGSGSLVVVAVPEHEAVRVSQASSAGVVGVVIVG